MVWSGKWLLKTANKAQKKKTLTHRKSPTRAHAYLNEINHLDQDDARTRTHARTHTYAVSCAVLVGNVSWMWFQEGRISKLRLKRAAGQAAHTRNNPHVKCTGVYCALTVNNADTNELYWRKNRPKNWVQFSGFWVPSLILTITDSPASFEAAGHRSRYFCRLNLSRIQLFLHSNPHIAREIKI